MLDRMDFVLRGGLSPGNWRGDLAEFLVTAAEPRDVQATYVDGRRL